ncbi:MAG TPA: vWA domain-containing protein [Pirellulales bacterium]|nr:vWA domain-containing protein [Pirellulales bacterium]
MAAKRAGPEKPPDSGGSPRRASWRGTGREGVPAAAEFSWQRIPQEKRSAVDARKRFRRRITLTSLTGILLLLAGAFVWYLLYTAPAAPLLAVAITDYPAPLPPNAFAQEDVDRFPSAEVAGGLLPRGRGNLRKTTVDATHWDSSETALKQIDEWLQGATPGGPRKNVVLLYLSAHGVVDEEGYPCLILPGGEPPFDCNRWLRLDRLIETLEKSRPGVKKLLMLDAARMDANWNIGLLYNGFAEALSKSVASTKSVAVLAAAGPGEVAHAAPELQGTPFGYFVARALAGDPAANADRDDEISVKELHQFVERKVTEWVARNRSDVQRPLLLLPDDRDFRLVFVVSGPAAGSESAPPAGAYFADVKPLWERIGDLWSQHERLLTAKDPMPVWFDRYHEWHQFQQGLLRCEQLTLAGAAYGANAKAEIDQAEQLADELARRGQDGPPLHNLTTIRRWHPWPLRQESSRTAIARHLDGSDEPPKPLPPEVASDYFVRADGTWQWLVAGGEDALRQPLERDKVHELLDFVGRPAQQAEPVELHLLRLLAGDAALTGSGAVDELWREPRRRLIEVLALRELGEQTISLADSRCHYAIRAAVADADRLLRESEDALFLGGAELAKSDQRVEQTQSAYRTAATTAEKLAAVWGVRDRAWSQLPYLAQWFCRRPQQDGTHDLSGIQGAARVIEQTGVLDDHLAHFVAEQTQSKKERLVGGKTIDGKPLDWQTLAATADRVEAGLSRLRTEFDQFADRVREQQTWDERSPRDIALLLGTPLVWGSRRRELRDRYWGEMSRRAATWDVANEASQRPAPQDNAEPQTAGLAAYLERLASDEHPALVLSGEKEPADDRTTKDAGPRDWLRLAKEGGRLRERLRQWFGPQAAGAKTDNQAGAADRRAGLSDLERQWRRIAPLCTIPLLRDKDPVRRLAQFDNNELLVWQTDRRLKDFWGNGDGDESAAPYFAAVFEEARAAGRKLAFDSADAERWHELAVLCNELIESAKTPVIAESGSEQPRLSHGSLVKTVRLNLPDRLPVGTAALSASDGLGRPAEVGEKTADVEGLAARFPIDIPKDGERTADRTLLMRQRVDSKQSPPANAAAASRWTLAWLFRGHYQAHPFVVAPEGPSIKVVYQRPPPRPTFVTVQGEESRQASVVFILDCSYSMREDSGTEGHQTRMDVARTALQRIVERLAESQKYRVGLWLYGHRATLTQERRARRWNDAWGPDNNVSPGEDVAQVIPLGLLDGTMTAQILALLGDGGKVQPWGYTPLYMSMVQALRSYQRGPVRGPRRLVVITDGLDQVPPNTPRVATPDDVIQAVRADREQNRDAPVRIQVLHCGTGGDESLRTLVEKRLQGDYISVSNWAQLEKKLQDAIGLAEYEVARLEGGAAAREQHLGEPFEVRDLLPGRKNRYEVRLAQRSPPVNSQVDLEGEESLVLSLMREAGQDRLVHERYDRGGQPMPNGALRKNVANPSLTEIDPDFNPGEFYVAAHRPERRVGGGWAFPISIQNGDARRFSPRPTEAWIEVTPVLADGSTLPAYPFYDLAFEPERPVPVLRCEAPTWPEQAQQAEIRMWFKVGHSGDDKSREVSIAELDSDASALRDLHVPGATDARFKVTTEEVPSGQVAEWPTWPGGCRLVVEEEYPPLIAKVEWSRVQTLEQPDRVVRTFNNDGRWARHEFYFAEKGRLDVRRDKVVVTARSSLQKAAMTVDEPLHVTLRD